MFETIINLKPKQQWREGLTVDGLIAELDKGFAVSRQSPTPGPLPIKARTDMLATRNSYADRHQGSRYRPFFEMEKLSRQIENRRESGPPAPQAPTPRRVIGGLTNLDVVPNREALCALMVSW